MLGPLAIQLCDFLTESLQGSCFLNQQELSSPGSEATRLLVALTITSVSESMSYEPDVFSRS